MVKPVAILDTNLAAYADLRTLEHLAGRFRLRVGETAVLEWWVQAARLYNDSRPRARAKFFGRAKRIAPFLDRECPTMVSAGHLARKILAEADGLAPVAESEERARGLVDQWGITVGQEYLDEEWCDFANVAQAHLDDVDQKLIDLAQPQQELEKLTPPALKEQSRLFGQLADSEQLAHLRRHAIECWRFSGAAAERLDARIATAALRLHAAAKGARMPKRNDGADVSLTIHLGDASFLLSDDQRLIDIVDQSGTYQAPWVRRSKEVDDLPEGPPWGESARRQAQLFERPP